MSADKKNNIITAAFWIGLLVHLMGYFFAGEFKNINICLLTVYFNMNMLGLVTLIVGNTAGLREGGVFLMVLGTYFFYMEFNDPMNWKNRDFTTLFLLITNIFFLRLYYNKIRKR